MISEAAERWKTRAGRTRVMVVSGDSCSTRSSNLSTAALWRAYEDVWMPPVGHDSSTAVVFGPGLYAPTDETTTTCSTSAVVAASSTRRAPSTFTRRIVRSRCPGCSIHARCTTASASRRIGARAAIARSRLRSISCQVTPAYSPSGAGARR